MRRSLLALLIPPLLAGAAAASAPPGASPFELQLVPGGIASPRVATAWEREGILYLGADDLSVLLGISKFWRSDLGRLRLVSESHEVSIYAGSDVAAIDKEMLHLPGPAFLWEGNLMVPLDLLFDAEGKARAWTEVPVTFSRETRRLEASRRPRTISRAEIAQEPAGWRLILESTVPFRHELTSARRTSFAVLLPGLAYDALLHPLPGEHRWFQSLRLRSLPGGLEVSFTPGPGVVGYRVVHQPDNHLEIFLGVDERDLRLGTLSEFAEPVRLRPSSVHTVALDPGHGGTDPGADLDGGTEAKLTWDLALMVQQRLQDALGVNCVLTRTRDSGADLTARAESANRSGADLFLSLHLHPRPGGPQGFVADVTPGEDRVPPGLDALGFRRFGAGQAPFLSTSRLLARFLEDTVAEHLGQNPLGVTAETLPELAAAAMPATILEVGRADGSWNRDRLGDVADGIVEGLRLFLVARERNE